jgi:predicted dehydrogenase
MRLGVIGIGDRLSGVIANAMLPADPQVRVVGVIDPDATAARERLPERDRSEARFYRTIAELVAGARPDALAIGTRCDLHAPYAIEAAAFGLPIYLEKPVANSLQQAHALETAFAASACPVVVSFPLRVSPLCRRAKEIITQGGIGRVEHLLGTNFVPYGDVYFRSWYRDHRITQGLFLQKATHDFDYLAFLAGSPIVRVAAMASKGRVYRDTTTRIGGEEDCEFHADIGLPETGMNEDSSSALLQFANGAQGVYTQVFFSRHRAAARGVTISGYQATLWFDWYDNRMKRMLHREPLLEVTTPPDSSPHFGGDEVLGRNFIDVVHRRATSLAPISAGLASVFACLAAKESSESGRFVDVHQVGFG